MALCQDPEVTYLNSLGYNVLAEPSAALNPLEVLGQNSSGVLDLGPLPAIWKTGAVAPAISTPQPAASISGGKTSDLSISVGLNLLSSVVSALGGQVPAINAAYGKASSLQFTLGDVTTVSVALTDLGTYLENGDVDSNNPITAPFFQNSEATIVVVHEVLQATSVTVTATAQTNATLGIDPGSLSRAVGGSLTIGPVAGQPPAGSSSALSYTGAVPITFAFKALHLAFSNGKWQLLGDEISSALGTLGAPAPTSSGPLSIIKNGVLSIGKAIGAAI